jgi:pimeloyl-ACP methyl ester carboxylesterase
LLKQALARYRALSRDASLLDFSVSRVLRAGDTDAALPKMRRLLVALGDMAAPVASPVDSLRYDSVLVAGVRHFQRRQGYTADGILGPTTVARLRRPVPERIRQIALSLERWRWLPPSFAEPPVIVAHSFGGFATILAGARHGDRLAGTVIVDSPVNPPDRPGGPPHRESRPHRIYPTLTEALSRFRLAPEQPCENDYIVDFIARKSLRAVEGGLTWKFDPSLWTHRFSIGDTAACLRNTRCRIAIMRGENSVLMPPEVGEYMYSLLGHAAPVIEIPQARHHVMLDQPLAFVAALRALLADWNHSLPTRRV